MSSPSRTFSAPLRGPRTKEGLAYDDSEPFEASRLLSRHVGRAASGDSPKPSHCAAYHARSVVTGSYGKIVLPVIDKPQPDITGPPYGRTASALVVPACKHPPEESFHFLRSGYRCRKMIIILSVIPSVEVPFVERTLGCLLL